MERKNVQLKELTDEEASKILGGMGMEMDPAAYAAMMQPTPAPTATPYGGMTSDQYASIMIDMWN